MTPFGTRTTARLPGAGARQCALVAGLLVLAVALPRETTGQETPADSLRPIPLDSVIVTVLRLPLALDDAPYSAATVDLADAIPAPGTDLAGTISALPGVQARTRWNWAVGERLSVRGFGARSPFGVRGLRLTVDGIPATLADGQSTLDHLDPVLLSRVQAVRAPVASDLGNGAGGALAFETGTSHRDGPPRLTASARAGSHGWRHWRAGVGGRAASWSFDVDATRLDWEGFRPRSDEEAPEGRYGTTDRWIGTVTASGPLAEGRLSISSHLLDLDAENPGSLPDSLAYRDEPPAWPGNVAQGTRKEVRQFQGGVRWSRPVAEAALLDLSGYGIARDLLNPIPPAIIDLDRVAAGAGAELSGSWSPAGRSTRWSVGTHLDLQDDDRRNFENEGGERGALTLDQEERVTGWAAHARLEVELSPALTSQAALRYDRTRFEVTDRFELGDPDDSDARVLDAWSPSLGLAWEPAPGWTVFTHLSSAFGTPTTTELANRPDGSRGFNPELEPERAHSAEMGLRWHRAPRDGTTARLELVLFGTRVEDELVPFEVPDAPGRSFFRNAGSSRYRGIEAAGSWSRNGWTGRASLTWTDARFTDFTVDGADFADNRIPGVAPLTVDGSLLWVPTAGLELELALRHSASIPTDDANRAETEPHTTSDLRARWSPPLDALPLELFGGIDNWTDEPYVAAVSVNAFGARYFEPAPGRIFWVGLSLTPTL